MVLHSIQNLSNELKSKGVSRKHILTLHNCEDKDDFLRKAAHSRFVRSCRHLGLDIATKQDKVKFLKSINTQNFLDLLHAGSGFLRGLFTFQGWNDRKEDKIIVSSMIHGTDIEPPEESYKEFEKFFALMQEEITVRNMGVWAVKLYFAIICAHLFPDGNGRLGRNAYFLMKSDGLLDEKKSSKRIKAITDACRSLNYGAINEMLKKDGVVVKYVNDVAADEDYAGEGDIFIDRGATQQLKYIAAKRVLEKNGKWNNQKLVSLHKKSLTEEERAEFKIEYNKVRVEWFWECISVAGKYHSTLSAKLDEILEK